MTMLTDWAKTKWFMQHGERSSYDMRNMSSYDVPVIVGPALAKGVFCAEFIDIIQRLTQYGPVRMAAHNTAIVAFPLDPWAAPEAVDAFDIHANLEFEEVGEWEAVDQEDERFTGVAFYARTESGFSFPDGVVHVIGIVLDTEAGPDADEVVYEENGNVLTTPSVKAWAELVRAEWRALVTATPEERDAMLREICRRDPEVPFALHLSQEDAGRHSARRGLRKIKFRLGRDPG